MIFVFQRQEPATMTSFSVDFILKIKVGFNIDVIGRYRQQFEFVSVFALLRSTCDRSTKLIPLSQSMRSKINELLAHVSPSLAPAVCHRFEWWWGLCVFSPVLMIGQSKYFGFGCTTLWWKPLWAGELVTYWSLYLLLYSYTINNCAELKSSSIDGKSFFSKTKLNETFSPLIWLEEESS